MAGCEKNARMTFPEIMAVLAESEKLAIDTYIRVRSRMPVSSEDECGNIQDDDDDVYMRSKTEKSDDFTAPSKSNSDKSTNITDSMPSGTSDAAPCPHGKKRNKPPVQETTGSPVINFDSGSNEGKTLRMVAYYMDRISFQCENHFGQIPADAMSEEDRLHCRRFHKSALKMTKGVPTRRVEY